MEEYIEKVDAGLREYVERTILPRYHSFDAAHRIDHVATVIAESLNLAAGHPEVDINMAYAIAAYHDTGLVAGRDRHHEASGAIVRAEAELRQWFSPEQIEVMAQAVEDHRASSGHAPRSIYGRIVAEADRVIDSEITLRRTVQYGLEHYGELDKEGQWHRFVEHLTEKYADGGYLQLWMPESGNAHRLARLRQLIADHQMLRSEFERLYSQCHENHS